MRTTTLFLCLLFTPAFAADIIVPVEATVQAQGSVPAEIISRVQDQTIQPMDCIRIWLDVPSEAVKSIEYGCHPKPQLILAGQTIDGKRAFLVFQAGSVGSFGIFVSHDAPTNRMKRYVIVTGGDVDPRPFPPPTPGKRKVIILEESQDRTPAQAKIILSSKLRKYLESKKHQFRVTDVDNVPRGNVPRSPLPLLIIEDGGGNPIYSGALPKTVEDTIETIKAHGG